MWRCLVGGEGGMFGHLERASLGPERDSIIREGLLATSRSLDGLPSLWGPECVVVARMDVKRAQSWS